MSTVASIQMCNLATGIYLLLANYCIVENNNRPFQTKIQLSYLLLLGPLSGRFVNLDMLPVDTFCVQMKPGPGRAPEQ